MYVYVTPIMKRILMKILFLVVVFNCLVMVFLVTWKDEVFTRNVKLLSGPITLNYLKQGSYKDDMNSVNSKIFSYSEKQSVKSKYGVNSTQCIHSYIANSNCRLKLTIECNSEKCYLEVLLNGKVVLNWTLSFSRRVLLLHIADTCTIQRNISYIIEEDVSNETKFHSKVSVFVSEIPLMEYIAGFGILSQPGALIQSLGLTLVNKSLLNDTLTHSALPRPMLLVGRSGYPGMTDMLHKDHAGWLNRDLYFGTLFPYNISQMTFDEVVSRHPDLRPASLRQSQHCKSLWRLAVIVPFRNRYQHLWIFLENLIRFLKFQGVVFRIFIIDQTGPQIFNRAALMNIGFREALKVANFNCFVFHDVDLIPENLNNLYACADKPRHLVVSRSYRDYIPAVSIGYEYFGGAIIMTLDQIQLINGFPNYIYGWGGEDDEILGRLRCKGLSVLRYPSEIGSYYSLSHDEQETGNPHVRQRYATLMYRYARVRIKLDGYNNTTYRVLGINHTSIYTHIYVRLPGPTTELGIKLAMRTLNQSHFDSDL